MTEKEQNAAWKNFREWVSTALDTFLAPDGLEASDAVVDELAQILECRAKELARAEGSGWQDIAQQGYPKDGQHVLVWRKWPGDIRETRFRDLRMPGPSWEGLYGWEPTHWHALPAPPAPGSAEEGR